ncbi:MAG: universal stress protein [Acidimicrobiales bacterium]|nr:universal stress protein [Acidimicrobiales bacterium]
MDLDASASPQLVLGDDLSPGADLAWLWTNSQRWPGWTLVDLQADPPTYSDTGTDPTARPVEGPPPRIAYREAAFAEVRFMVAAADPRVALGAWPDADLVVVGGSSSGVGPRYIGSTTEWLLHDPSNAVIVARRGRTVRSALVCADGSPHASSAADVLATMPWAGEVDVEVLAVDDGRTDGDAAIDAVVAVLEDRVGSLERSVRSARTPHRAILSRAQETDADLVVLGTHGLSTLRRLTLGSTANAVAQLSDSSVLVSRAPNTR